MAIVIRLQNLPWAGNSVDIRRYFSGLSIPEGGVHIVGGENGDAFIAFSTDEDARQAMERDGGKIKDMKVKLLLSSRAEMTRVIEQARSQNVALQPPAAIKAAANDSDRRKVLDSVPSPRRREREKSPVRDRERRRSSLKRDRSRSRSPSRRGRDRDREVDRRSDRSRRDERRPTSEDCQKRDDRVKVPRDQPHTSSRELSEQDRKVYRGGPSNSSSVQGADAHNKAFDARVASSPPNFTPSQMEPGRMGMLASDQRPVNIPNASAILENLSKLEFPIVPSSGVNRSKDDSRLPLYSAGGGFPAGFGIRDFPGNAASVSNYETKRPSPTPGSSAPSMVNSSYPKGSLDNNFANRPKTGMVSYSSTRSSDMDNIPSVPGENRLTRLNQPIYGAEPHIRYDQIPEPNQADKSANAPRAREAFGVEVPSYSKNLMPSSSGQPTKPRRSRFEPEQPIAEGGGYSSANMPDSKERLHGSFHSSSGRVNQPSVSEGMPSIRQRNMNESSNNAWSQRSSDAKQSWCDGRGALLAPPRPSPTRQEDFNQVVPMDLDTDDVEESPPQMTRTNLRGASNTAPPPMQRGMHHRPMDAPNVPSGLGNFDNRSSRRGPSERQPAVGNRNEPLHNRGSTMRGPIIPLTVEVRGLPNDVCERDVADFFRGIFIPTDNLKLQRNQRGEPNGCAFVKFTKSLDCEEALSRNDRCIRNHRINIISCPPFVFDNAPVSMPRNENMRGPDHRMNRQPCADDLCIELKNLPYSCSEDEIINFFDGLGILDIHLEQGTDGRPTGVAYVEFGTPADFHAALDMNGKSVGRRQVVIGTASKNIMAAAQGLLPGGGPKKLVYPQGPSSSREVNTLHAPREQRLHPSAQSPPDAIFCTALRGLPKMVKNSDIADFFGEINIIPRAIHIMLDPNKLPAGEAFAEFLDARQFDLALTRNGKFLAGSRISVTPIAHSEMLDILGGPPPGPPGPGAHQRISHDGDGPSRRPLMSLPMDEGPHPNDLHSIRNGPPRGRQPFDPHDRPMGPRAPFNGRMRGPMRPGFRLDGPPGPRGSPGFYPRQPAPRRQQEGEPLDFGTPGCVVGMDNLHFKAGLDEIMNFFHGYNVDKDSVIRKYNENGQSLGEARISFKCREDAVRAVKTLNQTPIYGRPLTLTLL